MPPHPPQHSHSNSNSNSHHESVMSTGTLYQPHAPSLTRVSTQQTIQTHHTATTEHSLSSDVQYTHSADVKLVLNFTPTEIELVRTTWKEMISDDLSKDGATNHASIASSLFCIQFYSNLLAMEPELEKMFPSIKHQAVSFSGVLATAIINLENLSTLDDYLSNLGKRHSRILGIDPPHFELMGVALLKTFHDRFGINFSLELERCWARLYTYLANSILQFGIDPVLRVDKINTDLQTLERTSTQNSLFDQRSVSTASTQTLVTSAVPLPPSSTTAVKPPPPSATSRSSMIPSSLANMKKESKEQRLGKRISSKASQMAGSSARGSAEEKDCVIM
ncbi:CYFA0S05e02454g1_1 [Cyberlindnera fabianii]|uniref:CYFA0S05e02454g1_1 n=1 Tax=Cyberlindnera fabianii TaxID=36022 RepID=A0A061B0T5_CYBFA|nr:Neuroglobin-1 [Cyberlindnera fabianii]CDR40615.1 CYFA0S05e02454g1_1 [Cyberlindnera fabianii]